MRKKKSHQLQLMDTTRQALLQLPGNGATAKGTAAIATVTGASFIADIILSC